MVMKITEEIGIETMLYRSRRDGSLVLEIDTAFDDDGEALRINLNDGLIYDGMPAHNDSAIETVRKIATLILPGLNSSRLDSEQRALLDSLDDMVNDHEPEEGWQR
ncbi:hypothetical protein [Microbacterium sp. ZOR0019]|uniref:hypothetical protein n=1 Tax=Microbacterium sp. ZOR0019 TaxID=1339233 RepID=UPI000646B0A7|nr:hypothetical protein [Microbacterium sp. ZOR0019]